MILELLLDDEFFATSVALEEGISIPVHCFNVILQHGNTVETAIANFTFVLHGVRHHVVLEMPPGDALLANVTLDIVSSVHFELMRTHQFIGGESFLASVTGKTQTLMIGLVLCDKVKSQCLSANSAIGLRVLGGYVNRPLPLG